MKYAIISHNIDFVTFMIYEYQRWIDLNDCRDYNNFESLLVYFDQTKDIKECFLNSILFDIPSVCEYFLSHGANINGKLYYDKTALHFAAISDSKEIVELLISRGANINEKDDDGETALHFAARANSKEIVEFLILHGANINEK
ncbi:proteasome regulatory particle assembly, partial [Trichomonas vaginalis G3]